MIPLDDLDHNLGRGLRNWGFQGPIGRKTSSLLATRSCLVIIIILFLTRFLQNAWTDFHEIFRNGVYWSSLAETNFLSHDVTSGPSYRRFSNFQGVFLFRDLLRNDSRYLLQIFTDDRQRPEVCTFRVSSLQLKKRRSAVGLENRV